MSERVNSSGNGHKGWDELRDKVAGGLRYVHTRANANTGKLLEVASFAYAAIELLAEQGLLQIEELDERKTAVAGRLVDSTGGLNAYVAYRQKVRRGTDLYLILGDPNADKTTARIAIKGVRTF